jgi:hypothetical protein
VKISQKSRRSLEADTTQELCYTYSSLLACMEWVASMSHMSSDIYIPCKRTAQKGRRHRDKMKGLQTELKY